MVSALCPHKYSLRNMCVCVWLQCDHFCLNFFGQLWNTFHPPELVKPALERTLKTLELDYVDLYIVEMPTAFKVHLYVIPHLK